MVHQTQLCHRTTDGFSPLKRMCPRRGDGKGPRETHLCFFIESYWILLVAVPFGLNKILAQRSDLACFAASAVKLGVSLGQCPLDTATNIGNAFFMQMTLMDKLRVRGVVSFFSICNSCWTSEVMTKWWDMLKPQESGVNKPPSGTDIDWWWSITRPHILHQWCEHQPMDLREAKEAPFLSRKHGLKDLTSNPWEVGLRRSFGMSLQCNATNAM